MLEFTPPFASRICWNELATTDMEACKRFYAKVFGWVHHETETAEGTYVTFRFGDEDVAGMFTQNNELDDTPPQWVPYFSVEDVDESVAEIVELGGKVLVPPNDAPNVGRFAIVEDPIGARFAVVTLDEGAA